jgi:hypothetical protein
VRPDEGKRELIKRAWWRYPTHGLHRGLESNRRCRGC